MANGDMTNEEMANDGVQNGGVENGGVVHGGVVHGGVVHGGVENGGVVHGGVENGGVVHGGSIGADEERGRAQVPVQGRRGGSRNRRAMWFSAAAAVVAAAALAGAGMSLALAGPAAGAAPATCGHGAPTLTLHGAGTATAPPGVVTVTLAVDTTQPSAEAALQADDATTAAVVTALRGRHVPSSDVQTSDLSMQPTYTYSAGSAPKLTGYQADDTLTVTLHDLATAGAAIDEAVHAAGDRARISSLSFAAADPVALADQARRAAVHDATAHAHSLAAAAGERLGLLCSLTDDTSTTPLLPQRSVFAQASGAPAAAVPLAAGTVDRSATVTLVYAVQPS